MALDHVRFDSPRQLAEALSLFWEGDFPNEIRAMPNGLAVPIKGFRRPEGGLKPFETYREQHGWSCSYVAGEKGQKTPLRNLVSGRWTYRDPLRYRSDGSHRDDGTIYDPAHPSTEYLLGARTRNEAAVLLDALTAHHANDIEFIPMVARGAPEFPYFWLLTTDGPPLDVLHSASRVWWGPAISGAQTPIYVEWPYSLDVPRGFLGRLPWNAGSDGIVLLSHGDEARAIVAPDGRYGAPDVIVLHADFIPRQAVERFAELRLAARVDDATVDPQEPKPLFDVRVTLERGGMQDRLAERVRILEQETEARRRLLESLRDEIQQSPPPAEPLFLFYASTTDGVPDELRRLLVDWTDHPGELGAVRYATLAGETLSDSGFDPASIVHLVTTNRALGEPGDPSVGPRLTEYRPRAGLAVYFDQLHEWTEFGLRLFVPHAQALRLYPHLRPGRSAATQLSRAFFGRDLPQEERSRWLVLLVNDRKGQMRSCRVDATALQPIAGAIRWRCAVRPAEATRADTREAAGNAAQSFFDAVGRDFEAAVERDANRRIATKNAELQAQLAGTAAMIERRHAGNKGVAAVIGGAAKCSAAITETVKKLDTAVHVLQLALPSPPPDLGTQIRSYDEAVQQLGRLKTQLNQLLTDIASLRR